MKTLEIIKTFAKCLDLLSMTEFSCSADLSMRQMWKLCRLKIYQRLSFLYQLYHGCFPFCINNITDAFLFVSTIYGSTEFIYDNS